MASLDLPVDVCQVWTLQFWDRTVSPWVPIVRTLHIRFVDREKGRVLAYCEEEDREREYAFEFLIDGQLTARTSLCMSDEEIVSRRSPGFEGEIQAGEVAWFVPRGQVDAEKLELVVVTNMVSADPDKRWCVSLKNNPAHLYLKARLHWGCSSERTTELISLTPGKSG